MKWRLFPGLNETRPCVSQTPRSAASSRAGHPALPRGGHANQSQLPSLVETKSHLCLGRDPVLSSLQRSQGNGRWKAEAVPRPCLSPSHTPLLWRPVGKEGQPRGPTGRPGLWLPSCLPAVPPRAQVPSGREWTINQDSRDLASRSCSLGKSGRGLGLGKALGILCVDKQVERAVLCVCVCI